MNYDGAVFENLFKTGRRPVKTHGTEEAVMEQQMVGNGAPIAPAFRR